MSIHKQAMSQLELGSKWSRSHSALALATHSVPLVLHRQPSYRGPNGPLDLVDLMHDRSQLVLYHFKLATSAHDAPSAGCPGCTRYIDNIDRVALDRLATRDTAFAIVSRAPIEAVEAYRHRMSWQHTWVSCGGAKPETLVPENTENHGISVFTRAGSQIYRRYITIARGMENIGPIWTVLDLPMSGAQQH